MKSKKSRTLLNMVKKDCKKSRKILEKLSQSQQDKEIGTKVCPECKSRMHYKTFKIYKNSINTLYRCNKCGKTKEKKEFSLDFCPISFFYPQEKPKKP
jgi:transposase-like protein